MKWTTKNGDKIEIKDMTTQHIKNCIKAIKEKRIIIGKNVEVGYTCDGDGDGRIYEWLDDGDNYIRAFEEELKKRKLRAVEVVLKELLEENKISKEEKKAISLNEYYALKNGLDIYKKIPELEQEVSILERAIERLKIWA